MHKLPTGYETDQWWADADTSPEDRQTISTGSAALLLSNEVIPPGQLDTDKQRENAQRALDAHEGWKLHLNIDPANVGAHNRLHDLLSEFNASNDRAHVVRYKIGAGGGAASLAPGKEVTVYVGSIDDTLEVALFIEKSLGGDLLPQIGVAASDVITDDVPFTDKVWGRFNIEGTQPRIGIDNFDLFARYGVDGVPDTNLQVNQAQFGGSRSAPNKEHNVARLTELYGSFFSSDTLPYGELLMKKRDLLQGTPEFATSLTENQQKIFAAPEQPVQNSTDSGSIVGGMLDVHDTTYDVHFGSDEEYHSYVSGGVGAASEGHRVGNRVATKETISQAIRAIAGLRDEIVKLNIEDVLGLNYKPQEAVDEIRRNNSLRYAIAASLLRKLDGLADAGQLPERVGRPNEAKSPARDYGGFSQMNSRDYVVALALSMLDGTFDDTKADSEQRSRPVKNRAFGQHRAAARLLLTNNDGPDNAS